jgi:hypothetical protein
MPAPSSRTSSAARAWSRWIATCTSTADLANLAAFWSRFAQDLRDAGRIAVDPDGSCRDLEPEVETALLERRAEVVTGGPHDVPQVEALAMQVDPAARDPRHVEEVVDEGREVPCLATDHVPRARGLVAAGVDPFEDVQSVSDRSRRISQLVRQDGEEVTLPLVRLARERRLTVRQLDEPALPLRDEVLDRVRDREVEPLVQPRELRHALLHSFDAGADLLSTFSEPRRRRRS